jgi:leucyl/phenylalanyl-tRNA--protein transferase
MPLSGARLRQRSGRIGWYSPVRRGVLLQGDLVVSRSLRRSARRFTVSVDHAFGDVIRACGDPSRRHGWIDRSIVEAYTTLHRLGIAHSVEVWDRDELAGGLYGLAIGGLFAGESMFHRRTDASKVALMALVELLGPDPDRLLDVQWLTPHLSSLGCTEIHRLEYARRLRMAMELVPPDVFRPSR